MNKIDIAKSLLREAIYEEIEKGLLGSKGPVVLSQQGRRGARAIFNREDIIRPPKTNDSVRSIKKVFPSLDVHPSTKESRKHYKKLKQVTGMFNPASVKKTVHRWNMTNEPQENREKEKRNAELLGIILPHKPSELKKRVKKD